MLGNYMKIPKDNISHNNFYLNPSIENIEIEGLDLDLSKKPNVFSSITTTAPISNNSKHFPRVKRLNSMDNEFLFNEGKNIEADTLNKSNSFNVFHLVNRASVAFKGFLEKMPVIGYFVTKEKRAKIKETLDSLNAINNDVDSLLKTSVPYGEQSGVYEVITENIMKANNIHAQMQKDISR